jgi:hypothetical protein
MSLNHSSVSRTTNSYKPRRLDFIMSCRLQPATLVPKFFLPFSRKPSRFPPCQKPRFLTSFDVARPCFAPRSSNSPSFIEILFLIKTKEKNSSYTKERNKSKKTTIPMVEGCGKHSCKDLGVEDDHHSRIRSIPFECQV